EDGIRDFHVTGVQTCALPILKTATVQRRRNPSPSFAALEQGRCFAGRSVISWKYNRSGPSGQGERLWRNSRPVVMRPHAASPRRSEERRVGRECRTASGRERG